MGEVCQKTDCYSCREPHAEAEREHWQAAARDWRYLAEEIARGHDKLQAILTQLVGDEAVEVVAEEIWNEREYRDPTGDYVEGWCPPGHDVHQQPPREPFLWEQMVSEGKYEGDQAEYRKDARAAVQAALKAAEEQVEAWAP